MVKFPGLPRLGESRSGLDGHLLLAASAEFLGMALFQLVAGTATTALAIAFSFAAIQYGIKYISGGHLNPAVSLAAAGSGHIRWSTGLIYALMQILGATAGALLQALLIPESHLGEKSAGCVSPRDDINGAELFGWELLLTFFFIVVQYSALFVRPGHGDAAPLASAVALYGILEAVGPITGLSPVNPAYTLAASFVYGCYWNFATVYVLAQLLAALLAAGWAVVWHGKGYYYWGAQALPEHEGRGEGGYEEGLLAGQPAQAEAAGLSRDDTFAPTGRA